MESAPDTDPEQSVSSQSVHRYLAVSLFGFLLVALGLAIDFVLHANDSNLAAEEGLFTLENPGHVLLGVGLVATALGLGRATSLMIKGSVGDAGLLGMGRLSLRIGMVVLLGSVVYVAAGPGFGDGHGEHTNGAVTLSDGVDRSRLPEEEALALAAIAASRSDGLADNSGHEHADSTHASSELTSEESEDLAAQLAAAAEIVPRYNTVAEAEADGYVQGSGVSDGAGAHWIKWSLVDRPFDLEAPSMLLFEELKRGEPPELIAFSYWVASDDEPDGFVGDADRWHAHLGMCFENGYLKDDNLPDSSSCDGDWINGSDLWMLHAWVVPGLENDLGLFATVNPLLCERACGLED